MFKISELMNRDIKSLDINTKLMDAILVMREHHIGAVIIKEQGQPVGIFTERDLLMKVDISDVQKLMALAVKDVMTENLIKVDHQEDYTNVIALMRDRRIRHTPVYENGHIVGIVSLRDLVVHFEEHLKGLLERNNRHHLESLNKVRLSESELEKAMSVQTDFALKVVHELRTPLAAIRGGVDLVLRRRAGEITEDQENYLSKSRNHLDRLNRLVDGILDLYKLEAGKARLDMQEHDINALMESVAESMFVALERKDIEKRYDFDPSCPSVSIDEDNISQVLCNLINNALKFTEQGSITLGTVYHPEEQQVEVFVRDTGPGMDEEQLARLFRKFEQVGPQPKDAKGSGLGLLICKEIIERHHGRIWFESEVGKGSCCRFTLGVVA